MSSSLTYGRLVPPAATNGALAKPEARAGA